MFHRRRRIVLSTFEADCHQAAVVHVVEQSSVELFFQEDHRCGNAHRQGAVDYRVAHDGKKDSISGGGMQVEKNHGSPILHQRRFDSIGQLAALYFFRIERRLHR
jgi:hypothetical protein